LNASNFTTKKVFRNFISKILKCIRNPERALCLLFNDYFSHRDTMGI